MIAQSKPKLIFQGAFDEREAAECQARGYHSHVWAELAGGERFQLTFYDPVRLSQDLEAELIDDCSFLAEPGLIVLKEVTRKNMQAAVEQLAIEGYFDGLRPEIQTDTAVRG